MTWPGVRRFRALARPQLAACAQCGAILRATDRGQTAENGPRAPSSARTRSLIPALMNVPQRPAGTPAAWNDGLVIPTNQRDRTLTPAMLEPISRHPEHPPSLGDRRRDRTVPDQPRPTGSERSWAGPRRGLCGVGDGALPAAAGADPAQIRIASPRPMRQPFDDSSLAASRTL